MKQGAIVLCAVLALACAGLAQEAQPAEEAAAPAGVENLHAEAGVGWMMPPEEPTATGLVYGGLNYGFPICDIIRLGGQVGGRLTLRDNDPDWLVSAGVFQREVKIKTTNTAWAVQGVYQNTWAKADLISLKPTFGVEIGDYDYLALTGVWGLNDENVSGGTQQPADQVMLLWGAEWSEEFRTEIGGGYEFQDIDEIILGVHAGYALDSMTSLNWTGAMDFAGNYYTAVALGFDIGATGRNATFNNITQKSESDYTPFPVGSLPVLFYESQPADVSGGVVPIPPEPE